MCLIVNGNQESCFNLQTSFR